MSISKSELLSSKELLNLKLNPEAADAVCKRALISDTDMTDIMKWIADDICQAKPDATVEDLFFYLENARSEDHVALKDRSDELESIKQRLRCIRDRRRDGIIDEETIWKSRDSKAFSAHKLSEPDMVRTLLLVCQIGPGMMKLTKMLREAFETLMSARPDATVGDLAYAICLGDKVETFPSFGKDLQDCELRPLRARFERFVPEDKNCNGSGTNRTKQSKALKRAAKQLVGNLCLDDIGPQNGLVFKDIISACGGRSATYIKCLVADTTNALSTDKVQELIDDVADHGGKRFTHNLRGFTTGDTPIEKTSCFNAIAVIAVPPELLEKAVNTVNNCGTPAPSLSMGTNDVPTFGIVVVAYDASGNLNAYGICNGGHGFSAPLLALDAEALADRNPDGALPAFRQLSFVPAPCSMSEKELEALRQDILHRLMVEYRRVRMAANTTSTFLDPQAFTASVCQLLCNLNTSWDEKYRKILDDWMYETTDGADTPDEMIAQMVVVRSKSERENKTEKLIGDLDEIRNVMNDLSAGVCCLSYNSRARLEDLGIDKRKLGVLRHKVDSLQEIVDAMYAEIDKTEDILVGMRS